MRELEQEAPDTSGREEHGCGYAASLWWTVSAVYLLFASIAVGHAQQTGRVRVLELPPMARVFVDGRPTPAQHGVVTVASGWHKVQVETQVKSDVKAYRRFVNVLAGQTKDLAVVWHPVLLAIDELGLLRNSPPGAAGPAGDTGPPARPYKPLTAKAGTEAFYPPLLEARDILLADLEAQVQDALNSQSGSAVPAYTYVPGPPEMGPPGPAGPIGPPGQPGIPAEVNLIEAPTGIRMRDVLAQHLELTQLQQTLAGLQQRIRRLSERPQDRMLSQPAPFRVLTPEWRAALDKEWMRRKAKTPQRLLGDNFGISGPIGAPGPRGPDGVAPPGTTAIRITRDQEDELLKKLVMEKSVLERVQTLRLQLKELAQRVYLAEGQYLERFPPPVLSPARH